MGSSFGLLNKLLDKLLDKLLTSIDGEGGAGSLRQAPVQVCARQTSPPGLPSAGARGESAPLCHRAMS